MNPKSENCYIHNECNSSQKLSTFFFNQKFSFQLCLPGVIKVATTEGWTPIGRLPVQSQMPRGCEKRPPALNTKLRRPSSPCFAGSRIYRRCANKGAWRKQTDCNHQFAAARRRPHFHALRQACNLLRPPPHARRTPGTQAVTVTQTRKCAENAATPHQVQTANFRK